MNLQQLKALWEVMSGKKFNTGTLVTFAAFILERYAGASHSDALAISSNVMMGIGGVTMLIGYIHRLIKSSAQKA